MTNKVIIEGLEKRVKDIDDRNYYSMSKPLPMLPREFIGDIITALKAQEEELQRLRQYEPVPIGEIPEEWKKLDAVIVSRHAPGTQWHGVSMTTRWSEMWGWNEYFNKHYPPTHATLPHPLEKTP